MLLRKLKLSRASQFNDDQIEVKKGVFEKSFTVLPAKSMSKKAEKSYYREPAKRRSNMWRAKVIRVKFVKLIYREIID